MSIPFYKSLIVGVVLIVSTNSNPVDIDLEKLYETLPRDEFVEFFNNQNFTYKIFNPSRRSYVEDSFGSIFAENLDLEVLYHDEAFIKNLPKSFDPREYSKWEKCETLREITNQGACGSCWAVSTTAVISDRICIHQTEVTRISPQDFECDYDYLNTKNDEIESVCNGGDPAQAMDHWVHNGLVSIECKPYVVAKLKNNVCHKSCVDDTNYYGDKSFGRKAYTIEPVPDQIKAELYKNGPIVVGFHAYKDIMMYQSGIYEFKFKGYTNEGGDHAVRLLGYGEENGVGYWLLANSWGTEWGEDGFFRVKDTFEFKLENGVQVFVAGLPA